MLASLPRFIRDNVPVEDRGDEMMPSATPRSSFIWAFVYLIFRRLFFYQYHSSFL